MSARRPPVPAASSARQNASLRAMRTCAIRPASSGCFKAMCLQNASMVVTVARQLHRFFVTGPPDSRNGKRVEDANEHHELAW